MFFMCPHLGLNAVESSEPEDLSSPQLPLCVVNLLVFFIHVLLWQFVLLSKLACPPQEAQSAVGYAGYDLTSGRDRVLIQKPRDTQRNR